MNAKVIVKVMNFHSLLRVDAARRRAEKYMLMEKEITGMIDLILHNKNLMLDKKTVRVNPKAPTLTFFIGSDFGFCGGINAQVNSAIAGGAAADERVLVGKKLRAGGKVLLRLTRESFFEEYGKIDAVVKKAVLDRAYSSIDIVYNHYHNAGTIEPVKKRVFPIEFAPKEQQDYNDDFIVEGDIDSLLESLVVTYLNYEIRIAAINSFASENIMRQNATTESLKRIEEREEQDARRERKLRTQKSFRKVIDAYIKKRGIEGGRA